MPIDPLMSNRRLLKKPPTWRQVLLFSLVFVGICVSAWGLQVLGYWPASWTTTTGTELPLD